jgi:hypothetical protein
LQEAIPLLAITLSLETSELVALVSLLLASVLLELLVVRPLREPLSSGATVTGNFAQFTEVTGVSGVFTSNLSGDTVTGTTANFTSGNFVDLFANNLTFGGDQTISGNFTVLSGLFVSGSGGFFTNTVTGATFTGISGTFTTQVSGATVTGNAGQFDTLTGNTAGFTTITGTTVTGTTANFATVSGTTVTGTTANFTNITGVTLEVTTPSGATPAIVCSGVVSGDTVGFRIQGPLIILP